MDSISTRAGLKRKVQFWFQFCIYLVVIGWFGHPFLDSISGITARSGWVQTPCVIESSELLGLAGASSNHTARVQVVYRYAFNGRDYEFSRQHLLKGSPATDERMNAALRGFPRGQKTICYVNPRHPAEAVLKRPSAANSFPFGLGSFPFGFGWVQLIPVVGSVIGLVVLWRRGWNPPGKSPAMSAEARRREGVAFLGRGLRADATSAESFRYAPRMRHLGRLLGFSFLALFWNGIVSVFVVLSFKSSGAGGGMNWFLSIFLIPFVLIGLWMIYRVGRSFLALFNPRPRLKFNGHTLAPGETLELEWRIQWRVQNLTRLKFVLEGREETTYSRGTRTYTDVNVFARWPIAETTQRDEMRSGRASLIIPPLTVPTFETPNNKIHWVIRIEGEIPRWPDLDEAMPLTLLPAQPARTPLSTSASL